VQQADQTERQAGSRVRYTVTVRNTAAAALTDVLVQAMLPVELLLINAEDGRTSGNTITWNIPSIAPDEIDSQEVADVIASREQQGNQVAVDRDLAIAHLVQHGLDMVGKIGNGIKTEHGA